MVIERERTATSDLEAPPARRRIPTTRDVREMIPVLGLKEYWYPALEARKVKDKPVGLKICGEQLVFFRGKDGVKALRNVCPHRGGSLMHGDCHYEGTISCPYHGWTFDGDGNVLAVLPEGPDSQVPGKVKHRAYPTQTLWGMVWVWMGEGDPEPIEKDVPAEFFRKEGVMRYAKEVWPSNWRICVENVSDAHVPYVHRDAMFTMFVPSQLSGPNGAPVVPINDCYVGQPRFGFGPGRAAPASKEGGAPPATARSRGAFQYYFPALSGRWPKHQWRLLWAWATRWVNKRRAARPPMETIEEWSGIGRHLPAIVHIDYRTHLFNRINVPIDEHNTRQVYTHYTTAKHWWAKAYELFIFHTFHRWAHYSNFSVQDFKAIQPQRYDTPEYLSRTDMPNVEWRRMVIRNARDLVRQRDGNGHGGAPEDLGDQQVWERESS